MQTKYEFDLATFEALKATRTNFDWQWQQIADYMIPQRADYIVRRFPGAKRQQLIYDTTAPWSLEVFAAGMASLLTNPALPWFYLGVEGINKKTPQITAWLQDCEQRINDVFNDNQTGFMSNLHELYIDVGAFGSGCMYIESTDDGVKFSTRFLGECYFRSNHWGQVDGLYRQFALNREQAISMFGAKVLSNEIIKCKDPIMHFGFLHACVPSEGGGTWDSRYYEQNQAAPIKEGFYHEFPYVTPRWSKSNFEIYGRGPGMKALPDVLMINEQKKTLLRAAHKLTDPAMLVPNGAFMVPINTAPGKINYYDATQALGVNAIRPLETGGNISIGENQLTDTQKSIIRAFYVDMLQSIGGGMQPGAQNQNLYATATEINARREQAMQQLGPMTTRLQQELLSPLIQRVYGIMKRRKALAPAPTMMQGKKMKIEYVSPLAAAQKQAQAAQFLQFIQLVTPLAQTNPQLLQTINGDEVVRWGADIFKLPAELLYTPQQLQAMQQAAAQAQQQAQQQQAQAQGGQPGKAPPGIAENNNVIDLARNLRATKEVSSFVGGMGNQT